MRTSSFFTIVTFSLSQFFNNLELLIHTLLGCILHRRHGFPRWDPKRRPGYSSSLSSISNDWGARGSLEKATVVYSFGAHYKCQ